MVRTHGLEIYNLDKAMNAIAEVFEKEKIIHKRGCSQPKAYL